MKFGPQTKEFATLLANVPSLDSERLNEMASLRKDDEAVTAWHHAIHELLNSDDLVEALTAVQFVTMYADYYPQVVLDAALAIASRHRVSHGDFTDEDYRVLVSPWQAIAGKVHPLDSEFCASVEVSDDRL